jgi:hypothetical protein
MPVSFKKRDCRREELSPLGNFVLRADVSCVHPFFPFVLFGGKSLISAYSDGQIATLGSALGKRDVA